MFDANSDSKYWGETRASEGVSFFPVVYDFLDIYVERTLVTARE